MFNFLYTSIFYLYDNLKTRSLYYLPLTLSPECDEVFPNIFVGNLHTIIDTKLLKQNNVNNILSAINGVPILYPDEFNYLNLELLDEPYFDIQSSFNESNKFIDECLKKNEKVYVHCMCGVSRSITLVIAYLIYKHNLTVEEALDQIRINRQKSNPNKGFITQLKKYYNDLKIVN